MRSRFGGKDDDYSFAYFKSGYLLDILMETWNCQLAHELEFSGEVQAGDRKLRVIIREVFRAMRLK